MQPIELTPVQKAERQYTLVTAETSRRSLRKFVRRAWALVDPKPYVEAWHIDALCVPGETIITTEAGPVPIRRIVESGWKGRVLSYSHARRSPQWRQITAAVATPFKPLYEIRAGSHILQLTGNHPVYVEGKGYVPAAQAQAGDVLLHVPALPARVRAQPSQDHEVLQPEVLRVAQGEAGDRHVPHVRRSQGVGRQYLPDLLRKAHSPRPASAVPGVWEAGVRDAGPMGTVCAHLRRILRSSVFRSFRDRIAQSCLYRWLIPSRIPEGVPTAAAAGDGTGFAPLLPVWCWAAARGPSHRPRQGQQQPRQSGDAMSAVSLRPASPSLWTDAAGSVGIGRVVIDSVARTVRTCGCLYNLAVEDNNNYFANGLLVHNCDHLVYVALGDIQNLMVNVPPRMTKSSVVSVAFPAWVWTDEPEIQFLAASYQQDLANGDAIKMRRIIESPWYRARYPHVILLGDQNRVDDFRNSEGGYRQTTSTGGVTTGLGGDWQLLDDPHNAATIESDAVRKGAVTWHDNAWRSRVNDPNKARRVYCGQRTHDGDIFGHVLGIEGKRWVHLNLAMEFDGSRRCVTHRNRGDGPIGEPIFRDPRQKANSLLCPARFDEKTAEREKNATSKRTWNAQYQQQPEGAGGVILKRKWWRKWEWPDWHPEYRKTEKPLPELLQVLQAYDTAFEDSEQDSFTVRTTWGLFEHADTIRRPNGQTAQLEPKIHGMLLERRKWRPSFGELLDDAIDANNQWEPDRVLVEKKASGHSLVQELRKKGIPVRAIKVQGDLMYRAHLSSLPLEKGSIWYMVRNWSSDLIEECAKFPNVDFNDQVASCVIAWMYMRRYMDLQIEDDDDTEELELFNPRILQNQRSGYYG